MNESLEYGKVSSPLLIREAMKRKGLQQRDVALLVQEHYQTISAVLAGRRPLAIKLAVKLDSLLGFPQGFLAMNQTAGQVKLEAAGFQDELQKKKVSILRKIKDNGGLWSYNSIPEHLDDDTIIEEGLLHLEFEEMPELFALWSLSHIKRVWRQRLLPQGSRLNILNYLLAVLFFHISNAKLYIERYERNV